LFFLKQDITESSYRQFGEAGCRKIIPPKQENTKWVKFSSNSCILPSHVLFLTRFLSANRDKLLGCKNVHMINIIYIFSVFFFFEKNIKNGLNLACLSQLSNNSLMIMLCFDFFV